MTVTFPDGAPFDFVGEGEPIHMRIQVATFSASVMFPCAFDAGLFRSLYADRVLLRWKAATAEHVAMVARDHCYIEPNVFAEAWREGLAAGTIGELPIGGELIAVATVPLALGKHEVERYRRAARKNEVETRDRRQRLNLGLADAIAFPPATALRAQMVYKGSAAILVSRVS